MYEVTNENCIRDGLDKQLMMIDDVKVVAAYERTTISHVRGSAGTKPPFLTDLSSTSLPYFYHGQDLRLCLCGCGIPCVCCQRLLWRGESTSGSSLQVVVMTMVMMMVMMMMMMMML